MTFLRRIKRISKICQFYDVSDTSQNNLLKVFLTIQKNPTKMVFQFYDVSDTSQNNLLKVFLTVQKNPTKMVFLADKTNVGPLKTLKK